MFKSLDSVVVIFMYLTISKFKQALRSRKGLDYNTAHKCLVTLVSSFFYRIQNTNISVLKNANLTHFVGEDHTT